MDVKGYGTGENYQMVEQGHIEEARTNAKLTLSDVSVRTVVRYMTGAQAAQQQQQQPQQEQGKQQESPEQDSMANGSAAVRSTVSAEQALLKIASSTVQKLPKLQGRQVTVKTAMTYIAHPDT